MAFKGLDFAKLSRDAEARRALPPEERDALEARGNFAYDARIIADDEKARDAGSSELRVLHLIERPDVRFDFSGDTTTALFYAEKGVDVDFANGAKGLQRAYYKMSEADRIITERSKEPVPLHAALAQLEKGSVVTVLGEERPRKWKGRDGGWITTVEFHADRIGVGELTREQLMKREPGSLADASLRYVAAKDEREKEVIAREYLGHPPLPDVDKLSGLTKGPDAGVDVAAYAADKGREGR